MQCNTIKLNINLETNMHRTKNLIWVFNIIILAAALPSEWEDMKGDLVKTFLLPVGSTEYNNVVTKTTKTGLNANIISVCCFWNTLSHITDVLYRVICLVVCTERSWCWLRISWKGH